MVDCYLPNYGWTATTNAPIKNCKTHSERLGMQARNEIEWLKHGFDVTDSLDPCPILNACQ